MIFWMVFVLLVLLWYAYVTVLVAFRGGRDIMNMINQLEQDKNNDEEV